MSVVVGIDPAGYAKAVAAGGAKQFVIAVTLRRTDPMLKKVEAASPTIDGAARVPLTLPLAPTRDFARAILGSVGPATAEIIAKSLNGRGALILTRSMEEACQISNRIAPEHLEVSSADPHRWEPLLRHAGAIFIGPYTSESLGDYCAGSNHVLPTGGSAVHSSGLSVQSFLRGIHVVDYSEAALRERAEDVPELLNLFPILRPRLRIEGFPKLAGHVVQSHVSPLPVGVRPMRVRALHEAGHVTVKRLQRRYDLRLSRLACSIDPIP